MVKQNIITYYRGTTSTWTINYSNANAVPGVSALFTVKATPGYDQDTLDSNAIVKKKVTLTDNSGSLVLNPSDIQDTVAPGNYFFDVKVIDSAGNIYPIVTGVFTLIATPTNRTS